MPRAPLHALIWSTDQTLYELYSRGQLTHRFRPDDDSWRTWLGAHTAFVFQGHSGRINLHNEQRTRTRRPASGAQLSAALSDAARKAEPLLLATKLAPPRLPAALVVRERLLHQLDDALAHRLTLLSAVAGWGKTTLLATWLNRQRLEARDWRLADSSLASSPQPVAPRLAWLSLDALDNDLTRFWVPLSRRCVAAYLPSASSRWLCCTHLSRRRRRPS